MDSIDVKSGCVHVTQEAFLNICKEVELHLLKKYREQFVQKKAHIQKTRCTSCLGGLLLMYTAEIMGAVYAGSIEKWEEERKVWALHPQIESLVEIGAAVLRSEEYEFEPEWPMRRQE